MHVPDGINTGATRCFGERLVDNERRFTKRECRVFFETPATLYQVYPCRSGRSDRTQSVHEYWNFVYIEFFSISLLTAVLLQFLLQVTIAIEHRVAGYFKKKTGMRAKVLRILSTWAILFASKLVILEAINFAFGDSVEFSGPIHGLVAFIIVVIAIIVAEQTITRIYNSLA
jgi:hypothetical protein